MMSLIILDAVKQPAFEIHRSLYEVFGIGGVFMVVAYIFILVFTFLFAIRMYKLMKKAMEYMDYKMK